MRSPGNPRNQGSTQAPDLHRRRLMQALLAAPAAAPLATLSAGAAQADVAASPDLALAAASMGLITSSVCAVLPATTEGPYYLDPDLLRGDITEDRTGVPLRLNLQVVTADCRPVEGARVDVWHCDAAGNYSGYATQGSDGTRDTAGQTFLRGTQMTDAQGVTGFDTIYPGWYRGRTTHVHYKVFLDERTVLTSQIFFPDALSQYLYDNSDPYLREGVRDTVNRDDGIAAQAGDGAYCAIREQPGGYVAALVVGVDPEAEWQEGGQGMGGPAGGPPPEGMAPPEGAGRDGAPGPGGPESGGPGTSANFDPARLIPGGSD